MRAAVSRAVNTNILAGFAVVHWHQLRVRVSHVQKVDVAHRGNIVGRLCYRPGRHTRQC